MQSADALLPEVVETRRQEAKEAERQRVQQEIEEKQRREAEEAERQRVRREAEERERADRLRQEGETRIAQIQARLQGEAEERNRRQAEAAEKQRRLEEERQRQEQARQQRELEERQAANLRRLEGSGRLERWVESRIQGWDHAAWQALLRDLEKEGFSPLVHTDLGLLLEKIKQEKVETRRRTEEAERQRLPEEQQKRAQTEKRRQKKGLEETTRRETEQEAGRRAALRFIGFGAGGAVLGGVGAGWVAVTLLDGLIVSASPSIGGLIGLFVGLYIATLSPFKGCKRCWRPGTVIEHEGRKWCSWCQDWTW